MKTRYVLHKRRRLLYGRLFSLSVSSVCCIICLLGGIAFLSGRVAFPYIERLPPVVISGCAFVAAFAFLYLHFAGRLFFNALIFHLADKSLGCTEANLNFRVVLKYIALTVTVLAVKTLWAVFFCFPAFSVLFIAVRAFEVNGSMPEMMLYALIAAFVVLLATGAAFFSVASGRYFICILLFLRNPKQKISSIIKTSAEFTCERLLTVLYYRLSILLKGKIYGKCMSVFLMGEIFCDGKYYGGFCGEKAEMNQSIPRAF